MSWSLMCGIAWALAATVTAFLPMRYQFPPGLVLLFAAPVLIAFIGFQHGIWVALLGLAAFMSMFRNPLRYFWRKARDRWIEAPK